MSSQTIGVVVFVALVVGLALVAFWPTKPPDRRAGTLERQPDGSQRPAWHLPQHRR